MPHFGGEKSNGGGGAGAVLESSNSMDLSVHSSNSSNTQEEKKHGADLLLSLAEKASEHASNTSTTTTSTSATKTKSLVSRQVTPLMERPLGTPMHSNNNRCISEEESGASGPTATVPGTPSMRMSVHGAPENHKLYPSPIKTQVSGLPLSSSSAPTGATTTPARASPDNDKDEKKDEGDSNEASSGKRTATADADGDDEALSKNKKARTDDNDTSSPTSALLSLASSPIRCSSSLNNSNNAANDKIKSATPSGNTISPASSNEIQQLPQQQHHQHVAPSSGAAPGAPATVVMAIAYHHNGQPMYAPTATAPYSTYMHHPNVVASSWPPVHHHHVPSGGPHPPPQMLAASPYSYRPHFMSPPQHPHHAVHHAGPSQPQYYHVMGPGVPVPVGYTSTMHGPPPHAQQHATPYQQHRISPVPPQQQQQQPQPAKSSSSSSPANDTVPTIMSPPRPRRTSPSTTASTTDETTSAKHAEAQAEACKSVSAWQQQQQQRQASMNGGGRGGGGTNTAASLRCIPLQNPMQSRCWSEMGHQDMLDLKLPDFPRLVNFPDYLAKGQARGGGGSGAGNDKGGATPEGKRRCVMCGKLRVCSTATGNRGGPSNRGSGGTSATSSSSSSAVSTSIGRAASPKNGEGESTTVHIIPRQNKGVCTACDVTVWMIAGDSALEATTDSKSTKTATKGKQQRKPSPHAYSNLEIKWCKGCKNFRPWAAFGEKGLATKCVRCRHRQREKYAMQKNESRTSVGQQQEQPAKPSSSSSKKTTIKAGTKRSSLTTSASPTSPLTSYMDEKKEDDMLAAQSLSNLMRCEEVEI